MRNEHAQHVLASKAWQERKETVVTKVIEEMWLDYRKRRKKVEEGRNLGLKNKIRMDSIGGKVNFGCKQKGCVSHLIKKYIEKIEDV